MTMTTAFVVALVLGILAGSAPAQITYVGSAPIGEHIIPEAVKAFTAKIGIPFGGFGTHASGVGLEMVIRGEAPLAGVSRSLTLEEKQQRLYYRIIGYDAIVIYVHAANSVTSLTKQQLKAIFTGRMSNWQEVGGADAPIVCIILNRVYYLKSWRQTGTDGRISRAGHGWRSLSRGPQRSRSVA
jgi:ABC-type phosphate transport system substrate-binding protein